jgi:hypothetical protein
MPARSFADLYGALGVEPDASPEDIRAAFRKMAWRWHPDRNRSPEAQSQFQKVNEAYATLNNPLLRAAYDRKRRAGVKDPPHAAGGPQPICCSECGRPTAQPRILAFQTVRSFVIWSKRNSVEGIFCVACSRRVALNASFVCAAWGWWAPLGPILTMAAIANNALGGARQPLSDHRLLLMNAKAFLASNNTALAYALARKVNATARPPLANEARQLMSALRSSGVPEKTPRLVDAWRPSLTHITAHLALALSGPVLLLIIALAFGWIGPLSTLLR